MQQQRVLLYTIDLSGEIASIDQLNDRHPCATAADATPSSYVKHGRFVALLLRPLALGHHVRSSDKLSRPHVPANNNKNRRGAQNMVVAYLKRERVHAALTEADAYTHVTQRHGFGREYRGCKGKLSGFFSTSR